MRKQEDWGQQGQGCRRRTLRRTGHRTVREVRPLTTSLDGVDGWSQATGTVDQELLFKKHFPCTETHKVCVLKIFIWYLH